MSNSTELSISNAREAAPFGLCLCLLRRELQAMLAYLLREKVLKTPICKKILQRSEDPVITSDRKGKKLILHYSNMQAALSDSAWQLFQD